MTSSLMSNELISLFREKIEEYLPTVAYDGGATEDEDAEWLEGYEDGMYAALRLFKGLVEQYGEIT